MRFSSKSTMLGLSLLEMVIALGVVSVAGILIGAILVNNSGIFYQQSSRVQQGVEANDALSQLRSKIKVAQSVAVGYPESSPIYTSSAQQLVLRVPAVDEADNIITGIYDYFIYSVENGILRERIYPDEQSSRNQQDGVFATTVDTIIFSYIDAADQQVTPQGAEKVKITLSLKQRIGLDLETSIATSEAYLQNN